MSEATAQGWLPILEERKIQSGIYPAQWFRGAISRGEINSPEPISDDQVQPASLDLRLGPTAYRVKASFLPSRKASVEEKVEWLAEDRVDLTNGAILDKDGVYIVRLLESLNLKKRMSAVTNPKSSTGRLDVFARIITDRCEGFDSIRSQYEGPLWLEIAPRSFRVAVRKGSRLVQLRVQRGEPRQSEKQLRALHEDVTVVRGDEQPDITKRGFSISVDIVGDPVSKLIGYKARDTDAHIDVDKVNYYDPREFWEPVYRPRQGGIILAPNDFHILASKAQISLPYDRAADLIAYDTLVGEFRVHYAGFFDPGFGYSPTGHGGAKAVLEVRSHEVPFMIEDGQIVGWLDVRRLTEKTDKPYGTTIGSSYQYQGLVLSKQFKR